MDANIWAFWWGYGLYSCYKLVSGCPFWPLKYKGILIYWWLARDCCWSEALLFSNLTPELWVLGSFFFSWMRYLYCLYSLEELFLGLLSLWTASCWGCWKHDLWFIWLWTWLIWLNINCWLFVLWFTRFMLCYCAYCMPPEITGSFGRWLKFGFDSCRWILEDVLIECRPFWNCGWFNN